jgi:hypothetical protein
MKKMKWWKKRSGSSTTCGRSSKVKVNPRISIQQIIITYNALAEEEEPRTKSSRFKIPFK